MTIKVAVVANCQARPLARILPLLNSDIEITNTAIVHLLKNEQEAEFSQILQNSDIIIAQQVADNYPCEFVRQNQLRDQYGDKVVSIINLYYSGYTPDLRYLRIPGLGTLRGPLGDYHNQTIFQSWREGLSPEKVIERVQSIEYNREKYQAISGASLAKLRKREQTASVDIVDYIESKLSDKRLFFSFNHPSMLLLEKMMRSMLVQLGVSITTSLPSLSLGEALDQFIPPVNCFSKEQLNINFECSGIFRGVEFDCTADGQVSTGGRLDYSLHSVVHAYYDIYEKNRALIEEKDIK